MEKKPVKKSFTAPSLSQKGSHNTTAKLNRGDGESKAIASNITEQKHKSKKLPLHKNKGLNFDTPQIKGATENEIIPKIKIKKDKQESLPEKAKVEKHLTDSQYAALFDAVLAKAACTSQDPCSEAADDEDECFKALESEDMDNSDIEKTENTVQVGDKSSHNKQERSVSENSTFKSSSLRKEEKTVLPKSKKQVPSKNEPAPKKQFKFFNNQERKSAASYAFNPAHAHVYKHKKAKPEPIHKQNQEKLNSHYGHKQRKPKHEPVYMPKKTVAPKTTSKELMLNREFIESGTWVQCDIPLCQKWRHLKDVQDPINVPEKWTCMLNTEENYNSCSMPEESWDESEHQEKFIYTRYTEGSVVWAKMAGFPWWPAMIEMDPDTGSFFEVEMQNSMLPTSYHVVFFDEKVSRAWISASFVMSFTGDDMEHISQRGKVNQSYKKEVGVAKTTAIKALRQPIQDRLKLYSFSKRFTGKWAHLENSEWSYQDMSIISCEECLVVQENLPSPARYASVDEPSKNIKKRKRKRSVDCSDELLDEFLQDAEVVLQNVEDALGSMEEELFSDGSSYILSRSPGVKNKSRKGSRHDGNAKDVDEKLNIPPTKTSKMVMTNNIQNLHGITKKPARPLPESESEGDEMETSNNQDEDNSRKSVRSGTLINDSLDEESCKSEGDMDDASSKSDGEMEEVDRGNVEGNESEAKNDDKRRNYAEEKEIEDSQLIKIEGDDNSDAENVPIDGDGRKEVYGSNDGNAIKEIELKKSHKVRPGIRKAGIVKHASPSKNKDIIAKNKEDTIKENRESKENKKTKKGKKLASTKHKTQNKEDDELSVTKQNENTEKEASRMDGKQVHKEPEVTPDATKDLVSTKKNKASKKKGKMGSKSIVEETFHVIDVKRNTNKIEELMKENCELELVLERIEKTDMPVTTNENQDKTLNDESRNKKKSKKSGKKKATEERTKDTDNSSNEKKSNKKEESTKKNKSKSIKTENVTLKRGVKQQKSDNNAASQASEDDCRSVSNASMKSSQKHSQKKSKGIFSAPKPIGPQSRVKEASVIMESKTKENKDRVVPKEFDDDDDMALDIETVDSLIDESSKKANICDNESDSDPFEFNLEDE